MKKHTYRNKAPYSTLHPDPRHWTRKQHSNSWKAKVAYESEEEAAEFLQQNPKLKALNYKIYICPICSKWHCGHLK
jgi:hypothetical protein